MAFGDGENDISMIAMAGIGVAMENGVDQVRAAADHVTGTNEEAGVAAAIRKFVFPCGHGERPDGTHRKGMTTWKQQRYLPGTGLKSLSRFIFWE